MNVMWCHFIVSLFCFDIEFDNIIYVNIFKNKI